MSSVSPYRSAIHCLRPRSYSPRRADQKSLSRIRRRTRELAGVTDTQLADIVSNERSKATTQPGKIDSKVLREVFACVAEAVRRCVGVTYYDVQILSGIVLASGAIAEMKTGEGKTLVAALPATLFAMAGRGVHIATVNSYLAKRDYETLRPVFQMLGLTVGLLEDRDSPEKKRAAYLCDITYGTGYEFGFDYLRDQLALQSEVRMPLGDRFRRRLKGIKALSENTVQRELAFAVIDEVDSVLIDEASTPLVISGPASDQESSSDVFQQAHDLAGQLEAETHYELDERKRTVELTEDGLDLAFEQQPIKIQRPWSVYIEQALRARFLMSRDTDYVVVDDKIKIVDANTGRIFDERTWRDGLHQAVEAKEGATITPENRSLAQVSRQRFYQQYDVVSGMTGTAVGHEQELEHFYRLSIVKIPLRKPCRRKRARPRFFANNEAKLSAAAIAIRETNGTGRPILVGTRTIEASRLLSAKLTELELPHTLLNGIQDEDEASIVAVAGEPGAITIATNMAGRGTDIKLPTETCELGGLHVLSLEFHESQRVDRQLEGRATRQGEPGTSQFFASAEDELLQKYDPKLADAIIRGANATGEAKRNYFAAIQRVQAAAEKSGYESRCRVDQQQQWLNKVLTAIAEPTQKKKQTGKAKGVAA